MVFARLGHFYPWASPTYMLNEMSIEQIITYKKRMEEMITGEKQDYPDSPPREQVEAFKGRSNYIQKGGS